MFKTLRAKVVGSFILLVIIPILIGATVILTQIKNTEMNQLNIIHTQMTKRVASEFENYVNNNMSQLKHLTDLHNMPFNTPANLKDKLTAQIMFNNNFDQLIFIDAEGNEIAHVHRFKILPIHQDKKYAKEMEYLYPKLNKSMYFGDVSFAPETGEPIADISFDVRDLVSKEFKGVMITSLRLKPIWNLLANISVQPGQQIYILDSDGRLVAHPNPSMVLRNTIYKVSDETITKGITGDLAYICYTKIDLGNQLFTIVSEHKITEAFKLLNYIAFIIFLVVASTIAMCILLMTYNIKCIVNPIKHLAAVAKEIEGGNLNKTVDIISHDEIGEMSEAFNRMTKKLKDNNMQLQEFNIGLQKKISTEIQKTRKMEQLLFEQKKFADMGQMINAIAHQWRQPLNNIGLIQQYLHEGFHSKKMTVEEFDSYSQSLISIVQNMSATIDDFRTFFSANKQKDRFNVVHALKDFLKLTSAQLDSSNIKYSIECKACDNRHIYDVNSMDLICKNTEIEILGHSGEFKQVLQNIISNARDAFMDHETPSPAITIILDVTKTSVILTFRDNAGGIPEDVLPKIFDPYFTTKDEGKGTGIGLYISKVIVDDHFGGRLRAENINGGAEFILTLPKAPAKFEI
ncbi:integral membrane sensor signal transduction histidine kinase [Denitrovibrio acetiphilus DSM 12809]|uniref:histidine kinase n=1 Tax=Denitrovibrio acetiphilus (strain DSM 12809 / NBRC 114555 / N2460) TaxID=522772 RepID=D4H636_DENA2|nr:sensor histidine kinase [Denitrovibrio acetiphilus]ADD67682.1 integral membrane sensor signal transduction histidine kinase [Denitrovibrio acetiphilus DSM 12809]